ncbi:flagellar biosynthesis protein FlhA [Frigidibacter sp. MR17.14]|uniref:flagellar biosynthesis protein FlhA n=1 Tax=Frigidibacter sp. MR17.14 TaxID=3126509 RepID=UPI003012A0B9
MMAVIVMMILPVPAVVLDIGLTLSFALAILMFTVTLFIERPLDFSAFPTALLASLMLRLSLNVSSTKLIVGEGHTGTAAAGHVIQAFADFIMGGSLTIGLVVFCVIMIVNFVVITKGAGRMAEVGARFALDAMPGKQLAIDADLAAGAIDHAEAKARREREQAETTFFGSLDGASKFVKGDAVAGLLITAINMLMGLTVGTLIHGMELGRAVETYAILTVGDGLVSQIPAVIISIAAAILLSRGGTKGAADVEFFRQLGAHPGALGTVAALLLGFALLPGLPFLPFLGAAVALAGFALMTRRAQLRARVAQAAPPPPEAPRTALGDLLELDEIHVEFSRSLIPMVLEPATGLDIRVANMRNHVARTFGLLLPEMRLTDDPLLEPDHYRIRVQGVEQAQDRLRPGAVLALIASNAEILPGGEDIREPVFGAPARWIPADQQEDAVLVGSTVVTPIEVLATHLLETIRRNLGRLMTLKALRRLLDELTRVSDPARAEANRRLFDELIPDRVPIDLLLAVLRLLLEEGVSIRNLPMILEAIAEGRGLGAPEAVCEHVRRRLGFQLVAELRRADGTLPLLQLAPEWEETFLRYQVEGERGQQDIALPPELFNKLAGNVADRLARAGEQGNFPAVVTSARRRRFLKTVLGARGVAAPVLCFDEIGLDARPALLGMVPA